MKISVFCLIGKRSLHSKMSSKREPWKWIQPICWNPEEEI